MDDIEEKLFKALRFGSKRTKYDSVYGIICVLEKTHSFDKAFHEITDADPEFWSRLALRAKALNKHWLVVEFFEFLDESSKSEWEIELLDFCFAHEKDIAEILE